MFGVWNKGSPGRLDGTVESLASAETFYILVFFRGYYLLVPYNFHLGIVRKLRSLDRAHICIGSDGWYSTIQYSNIQDDITADIIILAKGETAAAR